MLLVIAVFPVSALERIEVYTLRAGNTGRPGPNGPARIGPGLNGPGPFRPASLFIHLFTRPGPHAIGPGLARRAWPISIFLIKTKSFFLNPLFPLLTLFSLYVL